MPTTRSKRTREQVHQDGGHAAFVASCRLCATEREADQGAEITGDPPSAEQTTDPVPEPEATPAELAPEPVVVGASAPARAGDGRPLCRVPDCVLPEFIDGIGVCGGHYATHRGYATKARG